jgi:hypothetical protein
MRLRVRPLLPAALAAIALTAGCGGGHDAAEKQLAEMRAELTKLRAEHAALTERVDGLEIARGAFAKGAPADAPPSPDHDRPPLDVVRLAPEGGDADADTSGDGPRPVLRASGGGGVVEQAKKDKVIKKDKKGAAPAPKKADGDARPAAKP